MAGPWEDFQQQPAAPTDEAPPWADFGGAPPGAIPPAPPKQGGYISEAAKGVAEGAKNQIASALVGTGIAGAHEQDMLTRAIELAQSGVDPAEAASQVKREVETNTLARRPLGEVPLVKAGVAVQEFGKEALAPAPGWEKSLTRDVGSGFGSLGTNIGLGLVSPGLAAATVIPSGQGEAGLRAMQEGASIEQVEQATRLGSIAGATDMVDVAISSTGSVGKAAGLIRKIGVRTLQTALAEGGQEGLQQFIQNAIAKGIYKPDQDVWEDVPRSVLIGAIVGSVPGLVTGTIDARRDRPGPAPTPEEIAAAGGQFSPTPTNVPPAGTTAPPSVVPPAAAPPSPVDPLVPPGKDAPYILPANVVDFVQKRSQKLGDVESLAAPTEQPTTPSTPNPDAPMRQDREISAKPGVNIGRMSRLLGTSLYGNPDNIAGVSVKELFQNSFDSVKPLIEQGLAEDGHIDFTADPSRRAITIHDDGTGMAPETLAGPFLEIAGTKKETTKGSGGLGIAKMLYMYENKSLHVITMRDGQVSEMRTSGDELRGSMEAGGKAPTIAVRAPTLQDRQMFPRGHGTRVEVVVPDGYIDPSTGETKAIEFKPYEFQHQVLSRSPLFRKVHVTWNGDPVLNTGASFDAQAHSQAFNVKFRWGTARIYVTKQSQEDMKSWSSRNLHVLSNGIWQFSGRLKQKPTGGPYDENIARTFYLDLSPSVKPEEPGYPIALNRQSFSPSVQNDFDSLFKMISLMYQQREAEEMVDNYGDFQYVVTDAEGRVTATPKEKLQPKAPPKKTALSAVSEGDEIIVEDGQLIVNGREVPTLTPQQMQEFEVDYSKLKVDQSEINPNGVMIHDNVVVELSALEEQSLVEMGRERFGEDFDSYMFNLGSIFMELRDVVATTLGYEKLKQEAVGISFDPGYRGVSIRVPFSASFINPAGTEFQDAPKAGVGMVYTMVHELAHHKVRSHDADFPAEMQRIMNHLDTHSSFDFLELKKAAVLLVSRHENIHTWLNSILSGAHNFRITGKRFPEHSDDEVRDGGLLDRTPGSGQETGSIGEVSPRLAEGRRDTAARAQRGESNLRVTQARDVNRRDNQWRRSQAIFDEIDPGQKAVPPQPENDATRRMMDEVFDGNTPPPIQEMAAHADKMNRYYKWMIGLDRLVDRNPLFTPLLRYYEKITAMHREEAKLQDAAVRVAKQWRKLGTESENLTALLDDMANMVYRTDRERDRGIVRNPTEQEFRDLVQKHKLSSRGLLVYKNVRTMFDGFLQLLEKNAISAAQRTISDSDKLLETVAQIHERVRQLRERPYFPFMQFGSHFVTVKDENGDVVYFSTFERRGVRSAESIQQAKLKELKAHFPSTFEFKDGILPETAKPFIGMPSPLLDAMQRELELTPAQIDALEQLKLRLMPESSFAKLYQQKNYVKGYSDDFLRAFSRYFFHGAKYYARTLYASGLRGDIAAARSVSGNKAAAIANYMEDHLHNTVLDAKGDYGYFKGGIFLWQFGYSIAGASVNLSQIPGITYPFLAAKYGGIGFGDARATKALVKAMANLKTFYKKGKYDQFDDFTMKAMAYGIKTGRITETQAAELAAFAQGNNLLGLGSSKKLRAANLILEKSAWMFEMAEQFNRRVTFMAALDLARNHPTSKGVSDAVNKYAEEFKSLTDGGMPIHQARAVVAAIHAIEQTQFVYARYARPRFMRGSIAGTVFVFKHYMASVLWSMGNNKADVLPRYLIMMYAMSGMMGLPGMEDAEDLARIISRWMLGKDFKLRNEIREWVTSYTDKVSPELILHGLARKGFGAAWLNELLGTKLPVTDTSQQLGMGRLLPVELHKLAFPGDDPNKAISEQGQRASGAVFGLGFNFYKFLTAKDYEFSDAKRWEKVIPRQMAALSRSYRAFNEERERTGGPAGGTTIVKYDVRDPEHMAEILAMSMGYQTARLRREWDYIMAKSEVESKIKFEKEILMKQYWEALNGKKPEEISNVITAIREYNRDLPPWAKGMSFTPESITKSMQNRALSRAKREADVPLQKGAVGIAKHFQDLFPERTIDVRKVR